MKRSPVKSSNIKAIGFNHEKLILEVEFHNNNIYQYHPVTIAGYVELMKADSVGSFFNKNIKGNDTISVEKII